MEGKVKSHISNNTYETDLETLEEDDMDETSELYMIPISGNNIMVAPGKSIMKDGIAYCYVYVIKNDKVLCKLGVYEKKTDTMPLFFDISTFPEGSFCLFEEYEKNPSKLLEFKMIEPDEVDEAEDITQANRQGTPKNMNVFDYLMVEFAKIPNKRERLKSAYKSLFSTYETKKSIEKYKKMKPILKIISDAGKEEEPTDAFIQTLKTSVQDKPVFVMTLLALERIFFIEFTFVTESDMTDERDAYIKMKEDWPISNATKDLEVDVNTYVILEPEVKASEEEPELEPEDESESDAEPEPEAEPEAVSVPLTMKSKPKSKPASEPEAEPEAVPVPLTMKSKPKSKPATISETDPFSIVTEETVKVKKTKPKSESVPKASVPKASVPKAVYVPDEPMPAVGTYESPLSKTNIQSIIARTKSNKSIARLISDYKAGIMPSTPEDEKRLRSALVEMASDSLMKGKKKSDAASVLAAAVSRVKGEPAKEASLSTLSKKKEKANKPEPEAKANSMVTLKQNRSIPAVKPKSKPDKDA